MLKIYSDKSWLKSGNCHMLIPFWPNTYIKDTNDPDANRFDKYIQEISNIFCWSSLDDCDLIVYPMAPTTDPVDFSRIQNFISSKKNLFISFL